MLRRAFASRPRERIVPPPLRCWAVAQIAGERDGTPLPGATVLLLDNGQITCAFETFGRQREAFAVRVVLDERSIYTIDAAWLRSDEQRLMVERCPRLWPEPNESPPGVHEVDVLQVIRARLANAVVRYRARHNDHREHEKMAVESIPAELKQSRSWFRRR